jgi:hypothetical protein
MQIAFNNTKYLNDLHTYFSEISSKDWSACSKDMWEHFLKIANPIDRKQLNGIKVDKCNKVEGCFVFFDDSLENRVIVAWDDSDIEQIAGREKLEEKREKLEEK